MVGRPTIRKLKAVWRKYNSIQKKDQKSESYSQEIPYDITAFNLVLKFRECYSVQKPDTDTFYNTITALARNIYWLPPLITYCHTLIRFLPSSSITPDEKHLALGWHFSLYPVNRNWKMFYIKVFWFSWWPTRFFKCKMRLTRGIIN